MRDFHRLQVLETREEIDGRAKTVVFEVPPQRTETFAWRPGQHITLRFRLNGEELRRSYSVSASPFSGEPMRITVKRVKRGRVSNHINDHVKRGDTLEVMPPFGGFCLDPGHRLRRTHYFFAGGSGITPLFAMLNSALCAEPHSFCHLVYGNQDAGSIILRSELDALLVAHPRRLTVSHVLSRPSLFSSFGFWRRGRIDRAAIDAHFSENPPYAQDAQYYVCGPGAMNGAVRAGLMDLDVPVNRIHMESFGGNQMIDDSVSGVAANASVRLNGSVTNVPVKKDQTLLQAMRDGGLDPPFSCQSGVCGACAAKLTGGKVHMRARMALEDADVAKGRILTCQSVPVTEELSVRFG
ncbi:ferredoxin--NADP reductase [Hoeflea poritis]|uniref:Ferredoxin--NADP reductase n=1 Tax=Hoeflea poritis TaxID=2993659 RepID=A0ABT4VTG2_9HYPH|nr:ferredoxin--NADP reductase [Hoeflea poritis]MDA4847979.1 ferredoxin--NADP reductase [Hoeflea poritis]